MEPTTGDQELRVYTYAEIEQRKSEAFNEGYRLGRGEGQAITIGNWINGIIKSKTMWASASGMVLWISAELLPVVEQSLDGVIDPHTLGVVSAVFAALRLVTNKALPQK